MALKNVLNPEQRAEAEKFIEKVMNRLYANLGVSTGVHIETDCTMSCMPAVMLHTGFYRKKPITAGDQFKIVKPMFGKRGDLIIVLAPAQPHPEYKLVEVKWSEVKDCFKDLAALCYQDGNGDFGGELEKIKAFIRMDDTLCNFVFDEDHIREIEEKEADGFKVPETEYQNNPMFGMF